MADRTLVTYLEPRNDTGPYWRMNIERSSSGRPDVLITITSDWNDGRPQGHDEMTIVVENADEVFAPVMEWLAGRRADV